MRTLRVMLSVFSMLGLAACAKPPSTVEKALANLLQEKVPPVIEKVSIAVRAFPFSWQCRVKVKPGQQWHGWSSENSPSVVIPGGDGFIEAHQSKGTWLDYGTPTGQWVVDTDLTETADTQVVAHTLSMCMTQLAKAGDDTVQDKERRRRTEASNRKAWQAMAASGSH